MQIIMIMMYGCRNMASDRQTEGWKDRRKMWHAEVDAPTKKKTAAIFEKR